MKLKVVTRLQDNGDGGYTMYVYNNNQEMVDAFNESRKSWGMCELTLEEIEDDPYENGYLGTDEIEIEFDNGTPFLAKSLRFHVGQ